MTSGKRRRGAQRRSKKQYERHLEQKAKAKRERKEKNKSRKRVSFQFKKLWSYIWKLIVSVPILHRFFQFVFSFFQDS